MLAAQHFPPDPVQELRSEIFNLKELHSALTSDVSNTFSPPKFQYPDGNLQRQIVDISMLKADQAVLRRDMSELSQKLDEIMGKVNTLFQSVSSLLAHSSRQSPQNPMRIMSGSENRKIHSPSMCAPIDSDSNPEICEGAAFECHNIKTEVADDPSAKSVFSTNVSGAGHQKTWSRPGHQKRTYLDIHDPTVQILQDAQKIKRSFRRLFECTPDRFKRKYYLAGLFGIRQPNQKLGLEGSKLVSPDSPFNQAFDTVLIILLLYTAFVTPMQLSFWSTNGCEPYPTLPFDMFVDVFFMVDVVYRFFVGHYFLDGSYCDNFREIALLQFSSVGRFWFNFITSVPLSWVDYILLEQCSIRGSYPPNIDFFHLVKPLRLLKFLRLIKLSTVFRMMTDYIDNPLIAKLVKLVFIIYVAIHVSCCAFWAVKTDSSSPEEITMWLEERNLSLDSDVWEFYLICTYAMVTVFMTVGFGDIVATNNSERVYFVTVMLLAGCLFGTWLAQVQEIISAWNSREKITDERIQPAVDFMNDHRIPWSLRKKVRHWLRYKYNADLAQNVIYAKLELIGRFYHEQWKNVVEELPHSLRSNLTMFIYQSLFLKVPIISKIVDPTDRLRFVAALLTQLDTFYFQRGDLIASAGEPADKLMVMVSGRIALYLGKGKPSLDPSFQKELEKNTLKILKRGNSIGENALVGDFRWSGAWGVDANFCAVENGCIIYVPLAFITEAILENPVFATVKKMFEALSAAMPQRADSVENDVAKELKTTMPKRIDSVEKPRQRFFETSTFHWISLTRGLKEREKKMRIKRAKEEYKRKKAAMKKRGMQGGSKPGFFGGKNAAAKLDN